MQKTMGRPASASALFLWCACVATGLVAPRASRALPLTVTSMGRGAKGMADRRDDESRRQARIAQLVRTELAHIIRNGPVLVKTGDRVDADTMRATSVLDVDVSPDLAAATATITTRGDVAAKREAFSWLVKNEKAVRYALAKRLKHTKRVPAVRFRKADAAAATALMDLIASAADSPSGVHPALADARDAAAAVGSGGDDDFDRDDAPDAAP